jgi:hypothetical protein
MNQGEIGAEKIQKCYSLGDWWAELIKFSFKIVRLDFDVQKG